MKFYLLRGESHHLHLYTLSPCFYNYESVRIGRLRLYMFYTIITLFDNVYLLHIYSSNTMIYKKFQIIKTKNSFFTMYLKCIILYMNKSKIPAITYTNYFLNNILGF